jgi:hypothetical protein
MLEDTRALCAVVFFWLFPGLPLTVSLERQVVPALQRRKTKREVRNVLLLLGGGVCDGITEEENNGYVVCRRTVTPSAPPLYTKRLLNRYFKMT